MRFAPILDVFEENILIQRVLDAAFNVHKELGPGLLESAYQNALFLELDGLSLRVDREVEIPANYKGKPLGVAYRADLVVEGSLILELKTVEEISDDHVSQLLTYLRFANLKRGYVMNFSKRYFKDGLRRVSL